MIKFLSRCIAILSCALSDAGNLQYENLSAVIDDEVIIAPASVDVGVANMAVHPDGAIWINTTTCEPGLFRSSDSGRSWTAVPIELRDVRLPQYVAGFSATRDGTLWIIHQAPPTGGGLMPAPKAYVSVSKDQGNSWRTTRIEYSRFAATAPEDPYTAMEVAWCHPNLIERPGGITMFSASMRYDDWGDYLQSAQNRPGVRDVMIRTTDGGRTWGDPTIVHQHATETAYAVDPFDRNRILAATRIQRKALPGEDPGKVLEKTGVPYPPDSYIYKNGLLLESTDGGRTFAEVPGSLLGFGSYRFSMLWNQDNLVVLVSIAGQEPGQSTFDNDHVARISLDGGLTWADGTVQGTGELRRAKKFSLVPAYRDVGRSDHYSACVASTVELSSNRFLTLCRYKRDKILKGRFWHLEVVP